MDEFESPMPEGIESDSREYWKWRARQWQKRCQRAESEKTDLIAEVNALRGNAERLSENRRAFAQAVREGDVQPTGRDYTPRLPKGWR